jgi:hypothetical protein
MHGASKEISVNLLNIQEDNMDTKEIVKICSNFELKLLNKNQDALAGYVMVIEWAFKESLGKAFQELLKCELEGRQISWKLDKLYKALGACDYANSDNMWDIIDEIMRNDPKDPDIYALIDYLNIAIDSGVGKMFVNILRKQFPDKLSGEDKRILDKIILACYEKWPIQHNEAVQQI